MRKASYILILLLQFFAVAHAQKKVIYEDTSLLQKDEPVIPAASPDEVVVNPDSMVLNVPVEEVKEETETPPDTTLYKNSLGLRYDSVKRWRNLEEYAYTKYLDSLLKSQQKKKKAPEPPKTGLFNDILGSGILSLLLWTFVICFIGFILYQLFLSDGGFRRRSKKVKDIIAEVQEEIITPESDFDGLIRQALQNGNYRQAIRYQYLRTLHLLAGKNLVNLAPDKTNFQYVSEISNADMRQAFAGLTLNYEYVWYGEFDINKDIYEKIENGFRILNQKL
ncbi:MAG: DUF4129 domain-containing protein [Ferruginibacter sp.]